LIHRILWWSIIESCPSDCVGSIITTGVKLPTNDFGIANRN
jgi:hypothetical protein